MLSPVHSDCWVAAGTTGSGTRSTTRSSCLQTGHLEYRNQDLTSCKRMPARGGGSSCWQWLQRKKPRLPPLPPPPPNPQHTPPAPPPAGAPPPPPPRLATPPTPSPSPH